MDRDFIARNQIVERYIGGRLPLKGAQDFERFCREHPELLDEIALTERISAALGLLDAVGWETAIVLGVSFGGMVAQELAVTAPPAPDFRWATHLLFCPLLFGPCCLTGRFRAILRPPACGTNSCGTSSCGTS